jgi:hypothetical protein
MRMNTPPPGTLHLPRLIVQSHARWTGEALVDLCLPDAKMAGALWELDRVVVAHDTRADPVFLYGNRMALALFEMDAASFTRIPSRLSAEPVHQTERQRLLDEVSAKGFSRGYSGIRISGGGKRFRIENATLWNLAGGDGTLYGQAACFSKWTPVP